MCSRLVIEVTIVFILNQAHLAGKEEHSTLVQRHPTLTTSPAGRARGIVWCRDTMSKINMCESLYYYVNIKTNCNEKDWFTCS
jgi:hypothetical protein